LSFDACSGADQDGLRDGEHRGKMICGDSTTRWRRLENRLAMVDNEPRYERVINRTYRTYKSYRSYKSYL